VSSAAKAARVLLDVPGVLLGIAGAAPEQPQVAGDSDVVELLAVALGGDGAAGLPAAAGQVVGVGGVAYVAHGDLARMFARWRGLALPRLDGASMASTRRMASMALAS